MSLALGSGLIYSPHADPTSMGLWLWCAAANAAPVAVGKLHTVLLVPPAYLSVPAKMQPNKSYSHVYRF